MAEFTVQPNCQEVVASDGTRYRADGRGHVDVAEHHADQFRRSYTRDQGYIEERIHTIKVADSVDNRCGACNFNGFSWQTTCPRCGEPLIKETPAQ